MAIASDRQSFSNDDFVNLSDNQSLSLIDAFDQRIPEEFKKDSKFKKYSNAVEKILSSFDSIQEWADFIDFLTRLAKTLQSFPQYNVIPYKLVTSKRLSQCLHPNLPSGVHTKALEVYTTIFENIGPGQLAEDLPLWLCGLFPFLASASMTVKPQLLNIYKTFVLPLGRKLQPAAKAFIIALLPGMEEEGNEFFETVLRLMDQLNQVMAPGHFYECLWLAIISSPSLRRAAFNYLLKRVPKSNSSDALKTIVSDSCWFVRAIAVSLDDKEVLVQRGALELLLSSFPLPVLEFSNSQDTNLLLEAVLAVLLKKDMSLNRRVYAWMLGPEQGATKLQIPETTKTKMVSTLTQIFERQTTDEITELAKPYKIMVSLLDRNEIGSPVAQAMLTTILDSLRSNLARINDTSNDLLGTANMFFDMIDPFIFWQNLVLGLSESEEGSVGMFELISFVLAKIRLTDEDVAKIHLPQFFTLLNLHLDSIQLSPQVLQQGEIMLLPYLSMIDDALAVSGTSWRNLLSNAPVDSSETCTTETILRELHDRLLEFYALSPSRATSPTSETVSQVSSPRLLTAASNFGMSVPGNAKLVADLPRLLDVSLSSFLHFFLKFVTVSGTEDLNVIILEKLVGITTRLWDTCGAFYVAKHADQRIDSSSSILDKWCEELLRAVLVVQDFDSLDLVLTCLLDVFPYLPGFMHKLSDPTLMESIVKRLWSYLTPDYTLFHLRATELVWNYGDHVGFVVVEKIIAQYLTDSCRLVLENTSSDSSPQVLAHFDRFGVFYRLSDEQHLDTALKFSRPMLLVCDLLYSTHPIQKRIGETWLRNHVQNFMRLIEPLVHILTHSSIRSTPAVIKLESGDAIQLFYYAPRPVFNQSQVEYALNTLQVLCEFAPRDFQRGCNTIVRNSALLDKVSWVNTLLEGKVSAGKLKYAEFFVLICTQFLQSEFAADAPVDASVNATNLRIQMQCASFLATLLKRLDKSSVCTAAAAVMQDAVVQQLWYCIEHKQLDKQVELLRVLGAYELAIERDPEPAVTEMLQRISRALQVVIQDAILRRSNRRVLNHWIDFMLERLVYIPNAYHRLIYPVIGCLCSEMEAFMANFKQYQQLVSSSTLQNRRSSALSKQVAAIWGEELYPEQDVVVLMNALEKLLMVCLSDVRAANNLTLIDASANPVETPTKSMVSNFFFGDRSKPGSGGAGANPRGYIKTREAILNIFPSILITYYDFWCWFDQSFDQSSSAENLSSATKTAGQFERDRQSSNARIGQRLQRKIKDFMDALFDIYPNDLVESLVEIWYTLTFKDAEKANAAISMLHSIQMCTPKHIIMAIFDIVKYRTLQPPQSANSALQRFLVRRPELSDYALLQFLEEYCSLWMDLDSLGELLPYILLYCREVFGVPSRFKQLLGLLLRLVTICFDRAAQNMFYDDKKLKRDVEEVYPRLCEYCIQIAGRTFEQKLPKEHAEAAAEAMRSSAPNASAISTKDAEETGAKNDIKVALRKLSDEIVPFKDKSDDDLSDEMIHDLAQKVFPSLRKILQDAEKVSGILTSVTALIVEPVLRGRNRSHNSSFRYNSTLDLLCAMTKIPSSYKSYRKEVLDAFVDARFFDVNLTSLEAVQKWFVILSSCIAQEREIFSDVLARTNPSTSLFSSNTPERASMLRRIALLVLSSQPDHIMPLLPELQEKLVELLKAGDIPLLQVHVYLILQMLLFKLSWKAVANLWPTLVAELVRLFSETMIRMRQSKPGSSSENLEANPAFVSACQFLDLLLCLQPEGFQSYLWIFVTDVFPNSQSHFNGVPGLIDQLWQRLIDRGTVNIGFQYSSAHQSGEEQVATAPLAQTVTSGLGKLASSITSLAISSSSIIRNNSSHPNSNSLQPQQQGQMPRSKRPSFSGQSHSSSAASFAGMSASQLSSSSIESNSLFPGDTKLLSVENNYVPPSIIPFKVGSRVPLSFQPTSSKGLSEFYTIQLNAFLSFASTQIVMYMKSLSKPDYFIIERMLASEFILPPSSYFKVHYSKPPKPHSSSPKTLSGGSNAKTDKTIVIGSRHSSESVSGPISKKSSSSSLTGNSSSGSVMKQSKSLSKESSGTNLSAK